MYYHNETKLPLDTAFTLGEISYPANWLRLATPEAKESAGIKWKQPPELNFKDERLYYNRVDSDGNVVSTPKDLGDLKRKFTDNANRTAHSILSCSDWMVIRQQEAGVGILPQWADYRTAVRAEANRQCEHISAAPNVESLDTVDPNWPISPDEEARRLDNEND